MPLDQHPFDGADRPAFFMPGQFVRLRSGGPEMTVEEFDADTNQVQCWWPNTYGYREDAYFPPECLDLL